MRRNEELAKLQRRIIEVIQQLAKDEKFDLIVSDGVVYASDQVDITGKVIERLQQEGRAGKQ
jgi:outer membrane protein